MAATDYFAVAASSATDDWPTDPAVVAVRPADWLRTALSRIRPEFGPRLPWSEHREIGVAIPGLIGPG